MKLLLGITVLLLISGCFGNNIFKKRKYKAKIEEAIGEEIEIDDIQRHYEFPSYTSKSVRVYCHLKNEKDLKFIAGFKKTGEYSWNNYIEKKWNYDCKKSYKKTTNTLFKKCIVNTEFKDITPGDPTSLFVKIAEDSNFHPYINVVSKLDTNLKLEVVSYIFDPIQEKNTLSIAKKIKKIISHFKNEGFKNIEFDFFWLDNNYFKDKDLKKYNYRFILNGNGFETQHRDKVTANLFINIENNDIETNTDSIAKHISFDGSFLKNNYKEYIVK